MILKYSEAFWGMIVICTAILISIMCLATPWQNAGNHVKLISWLFLLMGFVIFIFLMGDKRTVKQSRKGVVKNDGTLTGEEVDPGDYLVIGFCDVVEVDMREDTLSLKKTIANKGDLILIGFTVDASVQNSNATMVYGVSEEDALKRISRSILSSLSTTTANLELYAVEFKDRPETKAGYVFSLADEIGARTLRQLTNRSYGGTLLSDGSVDFKSLGKKVSHIMVEPEIVSKEILAMMIKKLQEQLEAEGTEVQRLSVRKNIETYINMGIEKSLATLLGFKEAGVQLDGLAMSIILGNVPDSAIVTMNVGGGGGASKNINLIDANANKKK